MQQVWQERVEKAVRTKISGNTLAAFNTNVDVVVHLDQENVAQLCQDSEIDFSRVAQLNVEEIGSVQTKEEFVAVLRDCLGKGKSFYIVLTNMELLAWLDQVFADRQESMGGQAGIIANQMAALGANSSVYTSLLSPKQASMFFPEVKTPVANGRLELISVQEASRRDDNLKINWIFEYAKDEELFFGEERVVTPRANRVILATRPEGIVMAFRGAVGDRLADLGAKVDVAFMAGYHYAPAEQPALDQYLQDSLTDIRRLKAGNSQLRLHFEYVPMKDQEAEKRMLKTISTEIQSFGINENEIKRVLSGFGFQEEAEEINHNERAFALYQGALRLAEVLDFARIQVHNLGYYVVVLRKPYPISPESVREACLFGSSVNAIKAQKGGYVHQDEVARAAEIGLSTIGMDQLTGFAADLEAHGIAVPDGFLDEGILECDDHYAIVVPAHVVPNPVSTVGMGDTISSSSYACEFASSKQQVS